MKPVPPVVVGGQRAVSNAKAVNRHGHVVLEVPDTRSNPPVAVEPDDVPAPLVLRCPMTAVVGQLVDRSFVQIDGTAEALQLGDKFIPTLPIRLNVRESGGNVSVGRGQKNQAFVNRCDPAFQ